MAEMTKEEKQQFLDATIRRRTRWNNMAKDIVNGNDMEGTKLERLAGDILDDIVSSYDYNERLHMATRAVTFNKAYIRKVIRNAISDGSISPEDFTEADRLIAANEGNFSEAVPTLVEMFAERELKENA